MGFLKKYYIPVLLFIFIFLIYIHNLSLSVYGGDVGDLVTSAMVMGVAHPSGYPLFTFLGFLLSRINLFTPAFMVGLISVFSSVAAVILFYLFSLKLTKNKLISLISALILAFNYLFWFYAEIAEVFALNNLFVILLFFLSLLYYKTKNFKYFYALAFFIGLSLTNHHTIILLFPSLLIITCLNLFKENNKIKKIIFSLLFFILGLTPYVYVPIASFNSPVINWDNVKDLNSFLHLILRKDYGTFNAGAFSPPNLAQRWVILNNYFSILFFQLTIPVILVSFLGAIKLYLKEKMLFLAILVGYVISGPLFIGYAGFPLMNGFALGIYERFMTFSSIILLLFFPIGLNYFKEIMDKFIPKRLYGNLFVGVFLLIPIMLFRFNFPKTDLSNVYAGDNIAYDILSPLPYNSAVILTGDTVSFNSKYLHYGLNFRPDILIIDKPYADKDNSIINYLKLQLKSHPVFSSNRIELKTEKDILWMPYGLTYKLLLSKNELPDLNKYVNMQNKIWDQFKFIKAKNIDSLAYSSLTISEFKFQYSNSLLDTGSFIYVHYDDKKTALNYFNKARDFDKDNSRVYEVLGLYYLLDKDCQKTKENLDKAISINPTVFDYYKFSYYNYKTCLRDEVNAKKVLDYTNMYFKLDLGKNSSSEASLNLSK